MAYAFVHAALAAALFLAFWATGRAIVRVVRAPVAATRLPQIATVALGMIGWSAGLFALGAAGALRPAALRAAAGVAALAGAGLALRAAARAARRGGPRARVGGREAAALACLALALGLFFLLALDPRVVGDADSYHLTLPRLFLESGGLVRIPFFVYSTWPLATELLYALALAVRDHVVAQLLHFGCGLLLVVGAAHVARREAGPAAGCLAAALLLADPALGFEMRTAYVDLAFALYVFLAWCAFDPAAAAASPRSRRALLALAGVFLGGAAGTKLVGGLGAAVFAALALGRGLAARHAPRTLLADLACLLLPALALGAPWWLRSFALTGDPLHPALWGIFHGGGGEWSAELAARTAAHHRALGMGRAPWDFLLLPLRLTGGEASERFHGALHPVWALLLPVVAWGCAVDRTARSLALPALLYAGAWFLGSQSVRLLLPAQPFLAAAAAIGCVRAAEAIAPGRRAPLEVLALLAAAGVAAGTAHDAAPRLAELRALAARGEAALLDSAVPPHCRTVNEQLPPDARILMLNTNRSFFCRRAFLADSLFEASQLSEWLRSASDRDALLRLLRERGVTHVLVSNDDWGIEWPPPLREALADAALLRPLHRDADVSLYALSPEAGSPPRAAP